LRKEAAKSQCRPEIMRAYECRDQGGVVGHCEKSRKRYNLTTEEQIDESRGQEGVGGYHDHLNEAKS